MSDITPRPVVSLTGASERLFVVDVMAMAWRSHHAFGQRPLTTREGLPVSAVYGSAMFLLSLLEDEKPEYFCAATDSKEKTFRHERYPEYKANREAAPEEFVVQIPYLYRMFDAMGVPLLKQPGVEADDLIASLVTKLASPTRHCFIVSGDKDFLQLVDGNVFLYAPRKNEPAMVLGHAGTIEKWGCEPSQIVDMLAIMGDASDNVPGVTGIGEKGAAALLAKYRTLDGIYENLELVANARQREALRRDRESAYLSRELVTLRRDLPIELSLENMACDPKAILARKDLLELMRELEFKSLVARLSEHASRLNPREVGVAVEPAPPAGPVYATIADGQPNYRRADTPETLDEALREILAAPRFAFDTETTGLDIISDAPIGVSLSTTEGTGWYVPVIETHLQGITPGEVVARLKPLFADPTKIKIAHNLKFDLQMLANIGVTVASGLGDTMIMSWVLDSVAREHNLDACALREFRYQKIPTSELIGPRGERPMADCDLELLTRYACEDVDFTLRLAEVYEKRLREAGLWSVYEDVDLPLVPVLADMERHGVWVDASILGEIGFRLGKEAAALETEIHSLAGEPFNIGSPKQLGVILFEKLKIHEALGITRLKKTQHGFSTDVGVLEKLSAHPLPRAILEYRSVTKLKNTYVDVLPQLIQERTGRVHTSFHQTGTATGRLSSSDPNLQNIPIRTARGKAIRQAFRPQEDDWVMVSADYSQIELRLLAHLSGDEALREAFRHGADIHRATAARVLGIAPEEVTPEQRSQAKAINFGIIYGMGPQRLASETGVSMDEARTFIEKYFAGYPRVREFIDHSIATAKEKGYAVTLTGRRRPIPELRSTNRGDVVGGENIAVNSPVQGSASDLIKLAMVTIHRRLRQRRLRARLLLQVHDELVLECAREDLAAVTDLVREAMEQAMTVSVPLTVEVGSGRDWLEAH